MSDPVIIWHNPRCSKSRQTLALLQDRGVPVTERRYLDEAPDETTLRRVARALGGGPLDMMRVKEAAFREMGLSPDSPDDTLFQAMASEPRLIERPIVLIGDRAAIGRPPEAVLALFQGR